MRTFVGQIPPLRDHIEAKIGAKLDHRHPLLQCLIVGAASDRIEELCWEKMDEATGEPREDGARKLWQ